MFLIHSFKNNSRYRNAITCECVLDSTNDMRSTEFVLIVWHQQRPSIWPNKKYVQNKKEEGEKVDKGIDHTDKE